MRVTEAKSVIDGLSSRVRLGFFGASIMEHFVAYSPVLDDQAALLPEVGSQVTVEQWVHRGYVQMLASRLQVMNPYLAIEVANHAVGGSTSRDVLRIVSDVVDHSNSVFDIAFLGCGLNDVWRIYQGRTTEAVGIDEYRDNYVRIVGKLRARSRAVLCLSETPFSLPEAEAMNRTLSAYNEVARATAIESGLMYVDAWPIFMKVSYAFDAWATAGSQCPSLWTDGVHLTDYGDTLLAEAILDFLAREELLVKR